MAGGSEGGEKTEKPTAKKLQDAAKKGDILQSRELGTALVVMAGIGCLAVIGPSLIDALRDMLVEALRIRREDIVDFSPAKRGLDLLASIALPVAGVMLATFLAAIADVGSIFIFTCLVMAGGLFLIAGIDVPAQIMQRAKRLGMTKQEVKDEHKESEGSPELKGHIRRRQFEVLSGSTHKAVAEASVIITNPTHFAVALRYRPGQDAAPVVVAKGCDAIAASIRELADTHGVTVLQYPELARAIYFTSRAGHIVNEGLYMAVATVLAFVFRVENRMASEMDRPFITVPDDLRFDAEGRKL